MKSLKRAKAARLDKESLKDEARIGLWGKVASCLAAGGGLFYLIGLMFNIEILQYIGAVLLIPFILTLVSLGLVMSWAGINAGLPDFKGKGFVSASIIFAILAFSYGFFTDPTTGSYCMQYVHRYGSC